MKPYPILASLLTLLATTSSAFGSAHSATLYINFDGATLTPGWDDSSANESSLVWGRDVESLSVPAFSHGADERDEIAQCIRDGYAAFAIDVVTERPAAGAYVMVLVGGTNEMLGYTGSISGVSPFSGEAIDGAIVFVFEQSMGNHPRAVCETAVHETRHALGLDHAYLCEDPMSYLYGCGPKSFQDVDAECGEFEPRACEGGADTQNSYRYLAGTFGLRDEEVVPPAPEPDPHPEPNPGPDPTGSETDPAPTVDASVPDLIVYGPDSGETVAADTYVHIILWASDDTGIADIELGWATPDETYIFSCNDMPDDLPVMCTRDGSFYVFTLLVGTGERAFAVRAVDAEGNETVSDARTLTFA